MSTTNQTKLDETLMLSTDESSDEVGEPWVIVHGSDSDFCDMFCDWWWQNTSNSAHSISILSPASSSLKIDLPSWNVLYTRYSYYFLFWFFSYLYYLRCFICESIVTFLYFVWTFIHSWIWFGAQCEWRTMIDFSIDHLSLLHCFYAERS